MKSPLKFENDFREYSKAEKVTLAVILLLVTLVIISWAAQGFSHSQTKNREYNSDLVRTFEHKEPVRPNHSISEVEQNKT